jgi:Dolichyl-phosphate-mannose-protein mannosyltransferase
VLETLPSIFERVSAVIHADYSAMTGMKLFDVVVLLTLISLCVLFYGSAVPNNRYGYDEADYMYAASQGLYANYIDKNTIPLAQFLRIGLSKGFQAENRTSLSEFVRASGDIPFYRHYHGPLSFYALILWRHFVNSDEYSIRLISVLFSIATIATVYIGCFFLLQEKARLPALLASIMLLCSYPSIVTATAISTHGAYVLAAIATLFFMARLLQTNDVRYGYCTIVAMAFAFTATEYAPLLLITLATCLVLHRRELFPGWSRTKYYKALGIAAALFVGTIFLIWPGAWLKLTLIKNYIFMAYLALARQGEFGTQSFVQVWWQRVTNSPLEYTLVVATALIAMVHLRRCRWFLPFLIYAFFMLAATFRITTSAETYISSFLPPLLLLGAILISQYLQRLATVSQATIVSLVIVLFSLQGYFHVQSLSADKSQPGPLDQLVNFFHTNNSDDEEILTSRDFLPTLHYYFPEKRFQSYSEKLDNIVATVRGSSFNGVIYTSSNHIPFQQELGKYFYIQPETITPTSATEPETIYYKILGRLPTAH